MNINFNIAEKSGKVSPLYKSPWWDTSKESSGVFGFLRLCWHLWKWHRKVMEQARHSRQMREQDKDNYVFRTRQVITIETEN